jgi:hypothetical protein
MDLLPWTDESSSEIFFSRTKECSELLELIVTRAGEVSVRITCPKDRVTTIMIGKVELPSDIKRLGKKIFRAQAIKWLVEQMNRNYPTLKFGAGNTYHLCLKLCGRSVERRGKFRQ